MKKRKTFPSGSGRDAFPIAPREFQNLEWLGSLISHRETISNYNFGSDKSHAAITENLSEEDEQSPVSERDEDQQTQDLTIPTDEGESNVDKDGSKFDDEGDLLSMSPEYENTKRKNTQDEVGTKKTKKCRLNAKVGIDASDREKAWVAMRRKPSKQALDLALLRTAEQVAEASKMLRSKADIQASTKVVEDEDTLFCKSLAKRMQRLPLQTKAYIRVQIEQLMYQAEFNMQPEGTYGRRHHYQSDGYLSSSLNYPPQSGFPETVRHATTPIVEGSNYVASPQSQ